MCLQARVAKVECPPALFLFLTGSQEPLFRIAALTEFDKDLSRGWSLLLCQGDKTSLVRKAFSCDHYIFLPPVSCHPRFRWRCLLAWHKGILYLTRSLGGWQPFLRELGLLIDVFLGQWNIKRTSPTNLQRPTVTSMSAVFGYKPVLFDWLFVFVTFKI